MVAVADLVRFGLSGPSWVGWVNLPVGWLVPYLLGIAWARGSLRGRRVPVLMLAGGGAATAALIAWAGYPASMVGVNGAHISNLNPPTLAAVTFGIAQCGLALLLRDRLARLMRRPLAWAGVALVNLSAMTLFIWHQTAFITVSSVGLLAGRVPGLLTAPTGGVWVAERLAWLPVFAIVLAGLCLVFRRAERALGAAERPLGLDSLAERARLGLRAGGGVCPGAWRVPAGVIQGPSPRSSPCSARATGPGEEHCAHVRQGAKLRRRADESGRAVHQHVDVAGHVEGEGDPLFDE
jgi:hypothetical protein